MKTRDNYSEAKKVNIKTRIKKNQRIPPMHKILTLNLIFRRIKNVLYSYKIFILIIS